MKRMFLMMAIAIATTLQVPAQESKTKLTAQQRTEQRIKEMDEKLTLSDEQKTKSVNCMRISTSRNIPVKSAGKPSKN